MPRSSPAKLSATLWKGRRIGLLGGSFNPPHMGHVHASEVAIKALGLDAVWWLVSPGNPLKDNSGLPALQSRIDLARALTANPFLVISGIEKEFGTRRSLDTLQSLKKYFPHTDFIWLAGTDIAFEMHRWHKWRQLIRLVPLAFVGRPTRYGLVRSNNLRNMSRLRQVHVKRGMKPELKAGSIFWISSEPLNPLSLDANQARFAEKAAKG